MCFSDEAVSKDLCVTLCVLSVALCNFHFTVMQRFTEITQRTSEKYINKNSFETASSVACFILIVN